MLGASRHDRQSPMTTARDNQLLVRLKGCRTSSRRVGRTGRPHKGGVGTVSWDAAFTRTVMLHDSSQWVLRLRLASLRFLLSDAFRRTRSTRSTNSTPACGESHQSRKERGHSGFLRHSPSHGRRVHSGLMLAFGRVHCVFPLDHSPSSA